MEQSCSRCHETVRDGYRYCPACGLPQLVYSAEESGDAVQRDRWDDAMRDANTVDWRAAVRSILPLAVPAGILCSLFSPVSLPGLLLMGAAAAWAVALYTRSQRPAQNTAWITARAGARIGLVAGVVGAWTAAATTGVSLFAMRFWFHQGNVFDNFWQDTVNHKMVQEWESAGADTQTIATLKAMLLSPQGRAGFVLIAVLFLMTVVVLFAIAGGALGAHRLARPRRQGN